MLLAPCSLPFDRSTPFPVTSSLSHLVTPSIPRRLTTAVFQSTEQNFWGISYSTKISLLRSCLRTTCAERSRSIAPSHPRTLALSHPRSLVLSFFRSFVPSCLSVSPSPRHSLSPSPPHHRGISIIGAEFFGNHLFYKDFTAPQLPSHHLC